MAVSQVNMRYTMGIKMECENLYLMLNRICRGSYDIYSTEPVSDTEIGLNYTELHNFLSDKLLQKELKQIIFTGSEPFLSFDSLLKLTALSKDMKKKSICHTSGYWADTYENALEKLTELKKAGLGKLYLNYDYHKAKYIDINNIKNLLKAAVKTELNYSLRIIKTRGEMLGKLINQVEEYFMDANIIISPCLPVGNAKDTLSSEVFIRNLESKEKHCQNKEDLLIRYDGKIFFCASPGMQYTGLTAGDIHIDTYEKVKKRISRECLINCIQDKGFDTLIEVAEKELGIPIPEKIVSPCELCSILFSKENLEKIRKHFKETQKNVIFHVS